MNLTETQKQPNSDVSLRPLHKTLFKQQENRQLDESLIKNNQHHLLFLRVCLKP